MWIGQIRKYHTSYWLLKITANLLMRTRTILLLQFIPIDILFISKLYLYFSVRIDERETDVLVQESERGSGEVVNGWGSWRPQICGWPRLSVWPPGPQPSAGVEKLPHCHQQLQGEEFYENYLLAKIY